VLEELIHFSFLLTGMKLSLLKLQHNLFLMTMTISLSRKWIMSLRLEQTELYLA
jgi:hypothetical protein